jgi:diaminopimelate epimerase
MQLDFTKMQSLGNDFVVLDGVSREIHLTTSLARYIADRHFGIGCDQILLAEAGSTADFRFRVFNRDGSEVEQCGNGARCFARFLRDRGLTDRDEISVETVNSRMQLSIQAGGEVRVDMGAPVLDPERIPFVADRAADRYFLSLDGTELEIAALSMGNPHAVTFVDDVDRAPVERLGLQIESHPRFPARVNAGFCQVLSADHVRLRVYERGVGETLGCGSGACAAVVSGIRLGLLQDTVRVSLPGGDARVHWQGGETPVYLSGPATTVYRGVMPVPEDYPGANQ